MRAHVKNQSELEITVTRMAVGISASLKKPKEEMEGKRNRHWECMGERAVISSGAAEASFCSLYLGQVWEAKQERRGMRQSKLLRLADEMASQVMHFLSLSSAPLVGAAESTLSPLRGALSCDCRCVVIRRPT